MRDMVVYKPIPNGLISPVDFWSSPFTITISPTPWLLQGRLQRRSSTMVISRHSVFSFLITPFFSMRVRRMVVVTSLLPLLSSCSGEPEPNLVKAASRLWEGKGAPVLVNPSLASFSLGSGGQGHWKTGFYLGSLRTSSSPKVPNNCSTMTASWPRMSRSSWCPHCRWWLLSRLLQLRSRRRRCRRSPALQGAVGGGGAGDAGQGGGAGDPAVGAVVAPSRGQETAGDGTLHQNHLEW